MMAASSAASSSWTAGAAGVAAPETAAVHLSAAAAEKAAGKRPMEEITSKDVAAARQELLAELNLAALEAGHGPHAIEAAKTPTVESLTAALSILSPTQDRKLTPEEHAAAAVLDAFVRGTEPPVTAPHAEGGAYAFISQVVHQARTSTLGEGVAYAANTAAYATQTAVNAVNTAAGAFVRAGRVAQAFVQRVNANEDFQSTPAKIAASVANVAMRNTAAVFVPTAIRQFLSYGIEAALTKSGASDSVKTTLGLAAPVLAVGALALGAMRDRVAGTHTTTSERSRAIMGSTIAVAGIATAATGTMAAPGVASLMLAFTAYTAMRDLVVQSRLRMGNANTAGQVPDAKHFALISAGYGLDQGLVNLGMSTLASPSGPAAFSSGTGINPGNAFARAALNLVGEIGEDLIFQSIPAVRSHLDPNQESHALQLSIQDVGYQKNNLVNGALGPFAVRTGILATTIGVTSMVAAYAKDPAYANNPKLVEAVNDLIVGAFNAVLYEPFANAGSGQPTAQSTTAPVAAASMEMVSTAASPGSGDQFGSSRLLSGTGRSDRFMADWVAQATVETNSRAANAQVRRNDSHVVDIGAALQPPLARS